MIGFNNDIFNMLVQNSEAVTLIFCILICNAIQCIDPYLKIYFCLNKTLVFLTYYNSLSSRNILDLPVAN